jgi:hypothetical protein
VGTVAVGSVGGLLAGTQRGFGRLKNFKHLGREAGPAVSAVTEGLIRGTAAGAIGIFAGFQVQNDRFGIGNNCDSVPLFQVDNGLALF